MEFINLTPHMITLVQKVGSNKNKISNFKKCEGEYARIVSSRVWHKPIDGMGVYHVIKDSVIGLPEPKKNVIYLTSKRVMEAARRDDVLAPGDLIRNKQGIIVGCKSFMTYKPDESD
jgi:hypothetical protein